ncbi:hypothetical protein WP2S18C03_02070 [Aeromonas veronii]|nr:hypothetical protein WP2S18C03_02070 [Aeromonas veronii]
MLYNLRPCPWAELACVRNAPIPSTTDSIPDNIFLRSSSCMLPGSKPRSPLTTFHTFWISCFWGISRFSSAIYTLNIDSKILHAADTASRGSEFTFANARSNSASIAGTFLPFISSCNDLLGAELPSEMCPPERYWRLHRSSIEVSFPLKSFLGLDIGCPQSSLSSSSCSGISM